MFVYILGGFLGSGKTSLLMKIASLYSDKGKKVAIIVNESGSVGVDGATLKQRGYDAYELPQGCICCTLAGNLQDTMRQIKKDVDPDVVIIEPTGLAFPGKVREMIIETGLGEEKDAVIGIADVQRFKDLIRKKEDFFVNQMKDSDFIIINKSDLATPADIADAESWLHERFPDMTVVPVSVKTGENLDQVYKLMA
jgi:G3E family GTPase